MGQFEVYEYLKTKPDRWWQTDELAEEMGISRSAVLNGLKRLAKFKHIYLKKVTAEGQSHIISLARFRK